MEFDVFISYHTKSSTHITEAVCNALESKRIKCWYAPRNIEGSYAKSIVDAIGKCKIFLLILNKEASYSEDVLNEINLAVERVRKGEEIAIIPFHISEEDISPDAKYYLGRIHWVDAINPPMEKRINELVSRISYILNKNIESNEEVLKEENVLKNNYSLPIGNFIGRDNELVELEYYMKRTGKVFVKGMGGIGKSELVRKYINDHKSKYNTIVFAVYENSLIETIIKDEYFKISNFARRINSNGNPEDDITYFKRKMEKIHELTDEKTLIIIDNFDVMDDPNLKDILTGNYHLIFTTRNDFKQYKLPILELNPMTNMEDLLNLFKESYQLTLKDEDVPVIENIIELIGRHTLTVQLIASVMQEMRIKPSKMLEKLNTHGIDDDFQLDVTHNMQSYDSLYQCLSVLFKVSDLTEEEKNILKLLSLFPISGVEFEDFMELCEIDNGLIINKLIKRSFILHDYSLDKIALHPLISTLVEKEMPITIDEASTLIHNVASKYIWDLSIEEKEKMFNIHYILYNKFKEFDVKYGMDFKRFSDSFRDFNRPIDAKNILFKLKDMYEKDAEKYIFELGDVYGGIAYWHLVVEHNARIDIEYRLKAIKLYEAYKEYELTMGNEYRNVADDYISLCEFDTAEEYANKAYSIFLKYEKDAPVSYLGGIYITFAKLYFEKGEYNKTIELADKSYNTFFDYHKVETGDISSTYKIKGQVYAKLGKYDDAEKILEKAYNLRLKICQKHNSSPIRCLESLLEVYMLNNKYEKAKLGYEELYDIVKNYYVNCDEWLEEIKEKIDVCNEALSK